jgi:hypothetical protein
MSYFGSVVLRRRFVLFFLNDPISFLHFCDHLPFDQKSSLELSGQVSSKWGLTAFSVSNRHIYQH